MTLVWIIRLSDGRMFCETGEYEEAEKRAKKLIEGTDLKYLIL